jgi:hypothetical protein
MLARENSHCHPPSMSGGAVRYSTCAPQRNGSDARAIPGPVDGLGADDGTRVSTAPSNTL